MREGEKNFEKNLERKELGKVTTGITVHDERSVGGRGIGFAFAFAYLPPTFCVWRRLYHLRR